MSVNSQKKAASRLKARLCREKRLENRAKRAIQQRIPLIVLSSKDQYVTNSCGPCTACCTVVGVATLKKDMWTPCEHECNGCSIHGKHPQECKDYYCLYQGGFLRGGTEMRPDNLGVVIECRGDDNLPFLVLWEVWEGASESDKVQGFIRDMMRVYGGRPIVVRKYQSRTGFSYYGAEKYIQRVVELLKLGSLVDQKMLSEQP